MADQNIIRLLTDLAGDVAKRADAAESLATYLGGERLMIFTPAGEGEYSAPPGLTAAWSTLPECRRLLTECAAKGTAAAKLTASLGMSVKAWQSEDGSILMIAGGTPDSRRVREVRTLLPLVCQGFRAGSNEIARLKAELARAQDELQQFAYAAGHDLREPLRAISANADLLKRCLAAGKTEDTHKILDFMLRGAQRMDELTRALVSYAVVGSTPPAFEPVEAEVVLVMAEMNLETLIREAGAKVTHDPLPRICGDQIRLVQVFQNLLQNAIRYRSPETPRAHFAARIEDATATFSLKDNGEGIDPRFHEQVFRLFKRLHGPEIPGSGLGLCTSRKIVELHGGRIWLESAPGAGSIFSFTLPVDQ